VEVALRRRLEGVASVSISLGNQTTQVAFVGGQPFSPEVFREAVAEVGGEVLSFRIDACGALELMERQSWLVTGTDRFLLVGRELDPARQAICVSGRLENFTMPYRLGVTDVQVLN
jgi:hypothetical protein